eukprot:1921060-Amphidinium_carterae.1
MDSASIEGLQDSMRQVNNLVANSVQAAKALSTATRSIFHQRCLGDIAMTCIPCATTPAATFISHRNHSQF